MKRVILALSLLIGLGSPVLAQVPISGLPSGGVMQSTDYVPVVRGGVTYKAQPSDFLTDPLTVTDLPVIGTNTILGNATAGSATPTALPVPSCSGATNALSYTSASGFGCNTIASSIPGGASGTIQYNNGGVLGGYNLSGGLQAISGFLSTVSTPYFKTANYTVLSGDASGLLIYNSISTGTFTFPQAGTTGFEANKAFNFMNMNSGNLTITTTTSVFNGIPLSSGNIILAQYGWASCTSDGSNWNCIGQTSSTASGTVNSGTTGFLPYYATTGNAVSPSSILYQTTTQFGVGTSSPAAGQMVDIEGGSSLGGLTIGSSATGSTQININNSTAGAHNYQLFTTGSGNGPGYGGIFDATSSVALLGWNGANKTIETIALGVIGWTSGTNAGVAPDVGFSRVSSGGVVALGSGAQGNTLGTLQTAAFVSASTKFTTSGCSVSSTTGGATAGKFTLGANSCSVVITMAGATGRGAPNGWSCWANDETAPTIVISESANNTSTATFTIPAGAGATDVIDFGCMGF